MKLYSRASKTEHRDPNRFRIYGNQLIKVTKKDQVEWQSMRITRLIFMVPSSIVFILILEGGKG
jgi:hypothetical protein